MSTPLPEPAVPFDLDAYLARIGYAGRLDPTADVLAGLHLAHATHIPFENLDVLLKRPIRLDLDALQAKLVHARRGGYCFEQNLLFAAALERVGFRLTMLAARVRFRATRLLPRTHMLLMVETADGRWLADVGFGGVGPLEPLPMALDAERRQSHWTYRLTGEADAWVLQHRQPAGWQDLYAFTWEPQEVVDYEVANHYVSTHPDSIFTQTLTVQHRTPAARYVLRGSDLTIDRGETVETRTIPDAELPRLLADTFGLHLPADVRIPIQPPMC